MEHLILAIAPFVIAAITQGVKVLLLKLQSLKNKGPLYASVMRIVVATLSFAGVVISVAVNGGEVSALEIETYSYTLLEFLGATGIYFFLKNRETA